MHTLHQQLEATLTPDESAVGISLNYLRQLLSNLLVQVRDFAVFPLEGSNHFLRLAFLTPPDVSFDGSTPGRIVFGRSEVSCVIQDLQRSVLASWSLTFDRIIADVVFDAGPPLSTRLKPRPTESNMQSSTVDIDWVVVQQHYQTEDEQQSFGRYAELVRLQVNRNVITAFIKSFPFPDLFGPLRDVRFEAPAVLFTQTVVNAEYLFAKTSSTRFEQNIENACPTTVKLQPPSRPQREEAAGTAKQTLKYEHVTAEVRPIAGLEGLPEYVFIVPTTTLADLLKSRFPATHKDVDGDTWFIFYWNWWYTAQRSRIDAVISLTSGRLIFESSWRAYGAVSAGLQIGCVVVPVPGADADIDADIERLDIQVIPTVDEEGRLQLSPRADIGEVDVDISHIIWPLGEILDLVFDGLAEKSIRRFLTKRINETKTLVFDPREIASRQAVQYSWSLGTRSALFAADLVR